MRVLFWAALEAMAFVLGYNDDYVDDEAWVLENWWEMHVRGGMPW